MSAVGIVGLGAMGLPMAETLSGARFDVVGFDTDAGRRAMLPKSAGAIADLADCTAVVLSLPNDTVVATVVASLIETLSAGAVIIDTSTVAPETTRTLSAQAANVGIGYVDAPVSGGAQGVATGSLLVMAGGDADARAKALPVLEALARKVVPCGGPGAGNTVKLINNMLCAGQLVLAGEALRMAAAGGVAPDDLLEAVNTGSGRSAVTEVNLPRWVLSGTFDSAFTMGLMTKDVALADALDGAGDVARNVAETWQSALSKTGPDADFNRIVEVDPE
ncbi:MAG: NAD(P)-dependent oxidoreductase [Pseudomonadota bacterium]